MHTRGRLHNVTASALPEIAVLSAPVADNAHGHRQVKHVRLASIVAADGDAINLFGGVGPNKVTPGLLDAADEGEVARGWNRGLLAGDRNGEGVEDEGEVLGMAYILYAERHCWAKHPLIPRSEVIKDPEVNGGRDGSGASNGAIGAVEDEIGRGDGEELARVGLEVGRNIAVVLHSLGAALEAKNDVHHSNVHDGGHRLLGEVIDELNRLIGGDAHEDGNVVELAGGHGLKGLKGHLITVDNRRPLHHRGDGVANVDIALVGGFEELLGGGIAETGHLRGAGRKGAANKLGHLLHELHGSGQRKGGKGEGVADNNRLVEVIPRLGGDEVGRDREAAGGLAADRHVVLIAAEAANDLADKLKGLALILGLEVAADSVAVPKGAKDVEAIVCGDNDDVLILGKVGAIVEGNSGSAKLIVTAVVVDDNGQVGLGVEGRGVNVEVKAILRDRGGAHERGAGERGVGAERHAARGGLRAVEHAIPALLKRGGGGEAEVADRGLGEGDGAEGHDGVQLHNTAHSTIGCVGDGVSRHAGGNALALADLEGIRGGESGAVNEGQRYERGDEERLHSINAGGDALHHR